MAKYVSEDIQKIAERLKAARDRDRPAHFLTGAGCSISAGIPGAPDLIKRIHDDYPAHCSELPTDIRNSYGACMALLSLNERRDLIKPYLENAKINWGTIALAQLIVKGFVARVLTANFDLVLENACGLLGLQPAVYDFGVAPASDPEMIVSPSIIHLHGQSYGLVLLNTEVETREHREKLRPILLDSLRNAPLITIGYSGSTDGIFQSLFDEFEGRERLYWVSYEEEPKPHVRPFLDREHFQFIGGADFDRFMIEIAQALGCWPPNLFADPIGHLLEELRPVVAYPVSESSSSIDVLGELRRRLENLKGTAPDTGYSSMLRQMYMKGDYETAAKFFLSRPDRDASSKEDRDIAASSLLGLGNLKYNRAKDGSKESALQLTNEAIEHYDSALLINPDLVDALTNIGNVLTWKLKEGIGAPSDQIFEEATRRYRSAHKLSPKHHGTLYNWGNLLISYSNRVSDEKRKRQLVMEAKEKLDLALLIDPSKTYNSACAAAILGDEQKCREYLETGLRHGRLPSARLITEDSDMNSVREKPWFKLLLAQLIAGPTKSKSKGR